MECPFLGGPMVLGSLTAGTTNPTLGHQPGGEVAAHDRLRLAQPRRPARGGAALHRGTVRPRQRNCRVTAC